MVGIQEPAVGSKKPVAPIQDRSYVKWDENDQEEFELQLCKSVSIRDRVRMLETIARYIEIKRTVNCDTENIHCKL